MASIKSDKVVSYNLPLYLRGAALKWYLGQLIMLEKEGLRANIKNWIEILRRRFKANPTTALDKIQDIKFTIEDARKRHYAGIYVAQLLRWTAELEYLDVLALLTVWRNIDANLRVFVPQPTKNTTRADFVQAMDCMRDTWAEMYSGPKPKYDGYARSRNDDWINWPQQGSNTYWEKKKESQ